MSKLTFQEFQKICLPPEILNRPVDKQYLLQYMRIISTRISWIIRNIQWLTPNMFTVLMILWGPIASGLLLIPGFWGVIAFFIAHQILGIIDRIDGELARFRQQFSPAGNFLDDIAHLIIQSTVFVVLGWKFYKLTSNITYMYIGLISAIIMSVSGAIYHSGNFHTLEKKISSVEHVYKKNLFITILLEIKGAIVDHIEISMLGSLVLIIYIFFLQNPLIPQIFLIGYLILLIGTVLWIAINKYSSLIKNKLTK